MSATPITGVAVKTFVEMGVRRLNLDECESVSTDAVEWARGKGVDVSFRFPSLNKKGAFRNVAF